MRQLTTRVDRPGTSVERGPVGYICTTTTRPSFARAVLLFTRTMGREDGKTGRREDGKTTHGARLCVYISRVRIYPSYDTTGRKTVQPRNVTRASLSCFLPESKGARDGTKARSRHTNEDTRQRTPLHSKCHRIRLARPRPSHLPGLSRTAKPVVCDRARTPAQGRRRAPLQDDDDEASREVTQVMRL